ncbi:membrane protein [Weizmannia acidilactici]|nr:membrane protein [Weizmannia acidilactici]
MFFELKQVLKLKRLGLSNQDIRRKIKEENLFQFNNQGRINRALPSVMKRAEVIDDTLASLILEGSVEMGKVLNLYAIMKTDLLFYEFMEEVIAEKLHNNDYLIEKKDINLFFAAKSEQSEKVASWSDINIEKLKRAYMQVLYESGMLRTRKGKELNRLIIDEQIRNHLTQIGDVRYIRAMGE